MSFNTPAHEVTRQNPVGLVGMLVLANFYGCGEAVCSAAQVAQVSTLTVGTVTSDATYSWSINGIALSYLADSSATNAEIVAGIVAAIDASPAVRGQVSAVATSSTVATITARTAGLVFTLTTSDAKLAAAAVTAAASAGTVEVGRAVASFGRSAERDPRLKLACVADAANFTAQVDTHAVTYEASKTIRASVTVRGSIYEVDVATVTSATATANAIRDALNGILPADTVLASASSGTLTLTSELAGLPFESYARFTDNATTGAVASTSTAGVATDASKAIIGVSARRTDLEGSTYAANSVFMYAKDEPIFVEASAVGEEVYVELSGADAGKLFAASSATRVLLPAWSWGPLHSDAELAELVVAGG